MSISSDQSRLPKVRRVRLTRTRGGLVAGMAALIIAALSSGSTFADTPLAHTGQVGQHSLNDVHDTPGVTCNYDANHHLASIHVNAPNVFAYNKTGGVDHQKVGWRFLVQYWNDNIAGTSTYYKSSISKSNATDTYEAALVSKNVPLTLPDDMKPYTVVVKMYWYNADGSISGTATNRVDWYYEHVDGNYFTQDSCYHDSL